MATTTPLRFEPTITERDGEIVVTTHVHGADVDRPETHGYVCTNRKIAERLARAIEAGAVFTVTGVGTDVNGRTFLLYSSRVLGRMMNADLRRLGF